MAFTLGYGSDQPRGQIAVSITGKNVLYFNPDGVHCNGISAKITDTFNFLGVQFQPENLTFSLGVGENLGDFSIYGGINVTTQAPAASYPND